VYAVLEASGFGLAGAGSVADITACPGTDTCNLGISNSTGTALALSEVIEEEYPELLLNKEITVRISGCMNSCGQHGMASIGFHGSSLKVKGQVVPAVQVLIGGGILGSGNGRIADKVIKVPSKRAPQVLRLVLDDYYLQTNGETTFLDYSHAKGDRYYYELLKNLADTSELTSDEFIDWGQEIKFSTAIGVGECAGVMIDLVATLILEAEEKIEQGKLCIAGNAYADAIYHAYAAQIHAAKALLLQQNVQCNTQQGILNDFDKHFHETGIYKAEKSFKETVMSMNDNEPTASFANTYLEQAINFTKTATNIRESLLAAEG
jgi:sulfite reductase (ferredoxin)